MKNLKTLLSLLGLFFLAVSCSSDSSSSTSSSATMQIQARANYSNPAGRYASAAPGDVVITSFKVNISKIEFKAQDAEGNHHGHDGHDNGHVDGDNDHGYFNSDDATELNGPWEMDLLNQTAPITTVTIPNGTYEEVEFKLSPSLVATSPIFNKTVEVTGTINGVPFVFWHNFNEGFEVDYHNATQNLVVTNGSYDLVFNFDLNQILSNVDLSSAVDGDGDGLIEIGPDDTDGNNALANLFNQHMHGGCELQDGPHHH
jgi:hypothetical protein